MKQYHKYTFAGLIFLILLFAVLGAGAIISPSDLRSAAETGDTLTDKGNPKTKLPFPYTDKSIEDPLFNNPGSGLILGNPSNIKTKVEYNPKNGLYDVTQTIGKTNYRPPSYLDFDEYLDYEIHKSVKNYWRQKTHAESINQNRPLIPKLQVGGEMFDRIFGGNTIDIRPQGYVELIFAENTNRTQNPALPVKQRKVSTFDFDEKIQLNVVAKIGDKLKMTAKQNTESTFDFENLMKLEYNGHEDEIIKKVEAGNVTLPLTSSLITGSQSLFGLKTELQFGRLTATTVLSQQKGKKSEVEVKGGAQTSFYDIPGDSYEANRHYFLAQYFRDQYDKALSALPIVNSGVIITKVEVWVTNKTSSTENPRNIVAFTDLGEDNVHISNSENVKDSAGILPFNGANDLYYNMKNVYLNFGGGPRDISEVTTKLQNSPFKTAIDYERVERARKLGTSEFTFNARLGFISLNQSLNYDEVLAVAFQYTLNGKPYQVGEFATDGIADPQPLYVKMLKSTTINTRSPMYDLMMKNVYSIGAYQVNSQDFKLDIWYTNPATGVDITYIPEGAIKGKPLLQVMELDKLNSSQSTTPDGVFDFITGVTINPSNGRIYFPVLEPFGSHLYNKLLDNNVNNAAQAGRYTFQQLYDSTKSSAQQFPDKNRFKIKGSYQSSSGSDISLNAPNVPQGSVTVTAGGVQLTENVQYTVDYALGRVKIIDQGILASGVPIKISLESNALFSIQSKSLLGTHLDYRFSKDANLGATILHLTERPITQKINIGDEPISNTILGFDGNYKTETPFLTKLVDKIPFLQTKAMSSLSMKGEFADFIPGHSKAIGAQGRAYIDDFEGSQSSNDLKSVSTWLLASTPQGQPGMFPEAALVDSLPYGFNRAKLAWYVIDPSVFFQTNSGVTPYNIGKAEMSNHFSRQITDPEIFPNKQSPSGQIPPLPTLDLAFYPGERGPYNFDVKGLSGISKGVNPDGSLISPDTRWAGIMRKIETPDFEAANIEYIHFWMMDPYNEDNPLANQNQTGELYINLGNVSEDILRDNKKSAENSLPASGGGNVESTKWSKVPKVYLSVPTFDNNPSAREYQDVGFDGVKDAEEQSFFKNYLDDAKTQLSPEAYNTLSNDPAGDNYHYYRGDDYDASSLATKERYKNINGIEGNSPTQEQYSKINKAGYPTAATPNPNIEDVNRDYNMDAGESYFQYKIKLTPNDINPEKVGANFITNVYHATNIPTPDGRTRDVNWYQFKIPVKEFEKRVGDIQDFKSIRFMRVFFKGVDKPVVCRLAKFELIRGEWRTYNFSLLSNNDYTPNDKVSSFEVAAVNIEENGKRSPVNYVLPPGIDREINVQTTNLVKLNEQSMVLKTCGLRDGDAKAVYKNANLDVRAYKKLQMFVHAEASRNQILKNKDLSVFVRLGSDYVGNYYEYEIPLIVTDPKNTYNGSNLDDQKAVWPEANNLLLNFSDLQDAKLKRNAAGADITLPFTVMNGSNTIRVVGNPNLSSVKTIMIGVKNPKQTDNGLEDDGQTKCGEVWVNELRLTDFDEHGGWAARASVTANLADFGTLALAGSISTPGFGSIEKKVSERSRETVKTVDISSSLQLGKLIPEKMNIKIPMYVGYAQGVSTPQYNPLDPDILMKNATSNLSGPAKDSLLKMTEDVTTRRSLNFTNVKKDKSKGATKSHIYDVENLSATYSYNADSRTSTNIEKFDHRKYFGSLSYGFSPTVKSIKPFGKSKLLKSKYFALIKEFNFAPMPNRFGVTASMNREYSESLNRNTTASDVIILPTFNKNFTMSRVYDLKYDISKSLKFDFAATNLSRIMEPDGAIDTQEKKDSIIASIKNLGKTMQYDHTASVNYTIPLNKIPLLDFTTTTVRYGSTYGWLRSPLSLQSGKEDSIGNTIKNTNSWQWNGQLNMTMLYNKVPYLKKVNSKPAKPAEKPKPQKKTPLDKTKPKAGEDTTKVKKDYKIFEYMARVFMSVKNVSVTVSDNAGTNLPGYTKETNLLGMDGAFDGPSPGFIFGQQKFGSQKTNFADYALSQNWLKKSEAFNNPFSTSWDQNISGRASLEPLPNVKIELTANKNESETFSEVLKYNSSTEGFEHQSPITKGNFSMSFFTFRTAFGKVGEENFRNFLDNRSAISRRLGDANPNSGPTASGYAKGYGATAQDVLILSFLTSYSKQDPNKVELKTFPTIPIPNWKLTYDGLSKFEFVKKYFKTITLSHAYRSNYNVGSYSTNLNYNDKASLSDLMNNWIVDRQIAAVTIAESFTPFIRVDMTFLNSLSANMEFKKERTLSLVLESTQITEINRKEIVIGSGYRLKDLTLPFKMGGKVLKSDLVLKVDVSISNNQTAVRKIVEEVSQTTSGQNIISIKTKADYVLSERLNVSFFFDKIITNPLVSSSFPSANARSGLSFRYTLAQ